MGQIENVIAVVVHHKNFPTVLNTIEDVLGAGLPAASVVVIDNSETARIKEALEAAVPLGVKTRFTQNRGYASAVNQGLDFAEDAGAEFVLVLTHEVRFGHDCLTELLHAMRADPRLAVVAPTLLDGGSIAGDAVWSGGGVIRTPLRVPRHLHPPVQGGGSPRYCDWLDGAACLYRSAAVGRERLSEDYFLYFEETDFHVRLGDGGWRIAVVPEATAAQSSGGAPPYYLGRNFVLFQRRTGTHFSVLLAFVFPGLAVVRKVFRRREGVSSLFAVLNGIVDGYRVKLGRRGRKSR